MQKLGREQPPLSQGQRRQPKVPGCSTGVAARSYPTSEVRGGGRDELPHSRGQRLRLRQGTTLPRSGAVVKRTYLMLEVRGGDQEEQPHIQGAVAVGRGGPRGATPHPRSEGVAMRRYPSSKERSSGCALLQEP